MINQTDIIEYKTFEDLELYKVARQFRKQMYKLAKELPNMRNIIW